MDIKGLTIGNLFHPDSIRDGIIIPITDIVYRIGSINKFGEIEVIETENEDNITFKYGEYSPIQLTEEWLLKFGFEFNPNTDGFRKDPLSAEIFYSRSSGFYMFSVDPEIKYVHQLQNLYFVLTGEELPIK